MPTPNAGALVAGHLGDAVTAFKRGSDALRAAVALSKVEPIAGLDPEALGTFAAVSDANAPGVERMAAQLRRQLSPEDVPAATP